jgi:gliding motility-associated-like protein
LTVRCSLFSIRLSLFAVRCSLFDIRYSIFDGLRSIFAVRCSLFDIRYSIFGVLRSLFAFRYSLFAIRFSLFAFRYSLFAFRFSPFVIRNSQFVIRNWLSSLFPFLTLTLLTTSLFAQIDAGPNDTINPGVPVTLTVDYGFEANGVMLSDDDFAGPYPIGFNFSFFGDIYQQFYIASNGWITFSDNSYWAGTRNAFAIPSSADASAKNAILGPMQDLNPEITGSPYVFYQTIGEAPDRKLVVMWCQCPMYDCNDSLITFQIVLNETTSTIENQIYHKPFCGSNSNKATLGVQNKDGFMGFSVPGGSRNSVSWITWEEGWLYTPRSIDSFEIHQIPYHRQPIIPGDKIEYRWYEGSSLIANTKTVTVTPMKTSRYTAEVTLCEGETFRDSLIVHVIPYIPNAFTPNGDGLNDDFRLLGIPEENILHYSMQIYNRWGQMIFTTNDIMQPWDGKTNGTLCQEGVYIWMIYYEGETSGQVTNKGIITLLR